MELQLPVRSWLPNTPLLAACTARPPPAPSHFCQLPTVRLRICFWGDRTKAPGHLLSAKHRARDFIRSGTYTQIWNSFCRERKTSNTVGASRERTGLCFKANVHEDTGKSALTLRPRQVNRMTEQIFFRSCILQQKKTHGQRRENHVSKAYRMQTRCLRLCALPGDVISP